MTKLIDAELIIEELEKIIQLVKDADGVKVIPSKTGKWIEGELYIKCSECGFPAGHMSDNYCPNCGVKIKGGADK